MFDFRTLLRSSSCLLMISLLLACGGEPEPARSSADGSADGSLAAPAPVEEAPVVLFLGDSLTAGYGLSESQAFPAIVGRMLDDEGIDARVVNAGVSGDTTAGGLARLDWVLSQSPDVVVVGLGGTTGSGVSTWRPPRTTCGRSSAAARTPAPGWCSWG